MIKNWPNAMLVRSIVILGVCFSYISNANEISNWEDSLVAYYKAQVETVWTNLPLLSKDFDVDGKVDTLQKSVAGHLTGCDYFKEMLLDSPSAIIQCREYKINNIEYRFGAWCVSRLQRSIFLTANGYDKVEETDFDSAFQFLKLRILFDVDVKNISIKGFRSSVSNSLNVRGTFSGKQYKIPFTGGWFFFVDDRPGHNWAHPCRYVFLAKDLSAYVIVYSNEPCSVENNASRVELDILHESTNRAISSANGFSSFRNSINKANIGNALDYSQGDSSRSYALLISGGAEPSQNYSRYWGDVAMVYSTLRKKYGIPKSNITVCMSDGESSSSDMYIVGENRMISSPLDLDGDNVSDVNYSATKTQIESAFASIANKLTSNDQLFVFVTDHGAIEDDGTCYLVPWLGYTPSSFSETCISSTEFASYVRNIQAPICFAMEFCYSGGFVDELKAQTDRVIATACGVETSSAFVLSAALEGYSPIPLDAFDYCNPWAWAFNAAIRGYDSLWGWEPWKDADNRNVEDADVNGDGLVSMSEASETAKNFINSMSGYINGVYYSFWDSPQYGESIAGIGDEFFVLKQGEPYLNITESEVNVSAEGGTSSVRVESNGSFNLSADKDWIAIQNASGNGTKDVQFNVLRNSSVSGRKGTIKISNDYGNECVLSVLQAGMTAPARPVVTASDGASSDSVRITWENSARALSYSIKRAESTTGNKTLLDSNAVSPYVDNDVVPGKTYYYWVTAVNEVGENESVSDSGYRSISLNLDATGNVYTKDGGESSFSVSGNSPWTVSCADDWISLITTSGNGTGIVSFTLDKNYDGEARYGTILVTSGSVSKTITVTQPGRVLVAVNSGTVTINTGASSPSFNVSSSGKTYYGKVVDGTAVYSFDYLEIGSSVSVSISGSRPLVIESETDMKIACDLDVSGTSAGRCGGGIGGAGGSGGASVSGGSGGSGGSYGLGGNGWIIDNYAGETQGQSGSSGSAGSTGYGGSAGKSGTSGSSGGKGFGSTGSAASGGSRGSGGSAGSAASSVGRAGSGGYAGSEGNAGGSGTKGGAGTAGNNGSSGSNGVNAFTAALTTDVIIAGSGGGGGGGGGSGGSGGGGSGGGGGGGGGGTTEAQARAYNSNTVYINRKQYQGAMGGFGGGGGSGGKGASSGAGGAGGAGGHGGGAVVLKAAGVLQLSGCVDVSAANGSRNGSSGSSASSASYGSSGGSGSTGQSAMTTTGYTYLSPSSGCRGGNGGSGGAGGSGGKGGSGGTGGYGSPGMVKLYASVLLASNGSIAGANGDNSTTASRCGGLSLGTNMKPTTLTSQKPTVPTTIKCGEMGGAVSSKTASVYDESVMVPVVGQLKTLHADVAGICETGNYALSQVSSAVAEGSVEGLLVKRLTTLFDGYDQIFLINNSSTKVGPVEAEISGVACEIPELDAGEAWTTCVPTGVSVTGSEALIVSHSSIAAEASGRSGTVSVTANCGWTVSKNVSWITVSSTSGSGNGTISYTIAANTTVQSRSGTITVTSSGGITRTIAVSQEGLPMYDVTFNSNGGTLSGDATRNVVSGAVIGALPTPTRDGYTFLGWFTAANGGEQVTESTVVTGNMTLYAHWEEYAGVDDDGYTLVSMFEYEICADGVRITKYKGTAAVVNIPPTIDGFPVISIDDYAFMDCNSLTSVTIPEGVQSIGAMAFRNCGSLTHVSIPDSVVEIGSDPFIYSNYSLFSWDGKGTKLVDGWVVGSTDSPAMWDVDLDLIGVRGICEAAFYSKDYITSVVIPGSVRFVDGNTFRFCSSLTNVMVCSGVKSIGECAFGECGSLTKVTISDSVTNIAQNAFYGCSELVFVMIPLTLKEQIEARDVFADCSSDLQIDYYCTVTFNANGGALSEDGAIEAIVDETIGTLPIPTRDGYTFLGWFTAAEGGEQITESTVVTGNMTLYAHWEAVTIEPQWTIDENGVLTRVELNGATEVAIPSNVKVIGDSVFSGYMLTKVTIPEGVGSIGNMAFECCAGLTEIKIPPSVTNIGASAFSGCNDLRKVEGGANLERVGWSAFCDTSFLYGEDSWESVQTNEYYTTGRGLKPVYVGSFIVDHVGYLSESSDEKYYDENGNWTWEYDLVIREGTTGIADYLFHALPITSVTIPGSIKLIPENVFQNCRNLKNLIINEGVEEIGKYAFSYAGCNLEEDVITALTIPSSVVKIGEYAFADFGYLKYVIGLDDTDDISGDAFIWTPYVEGWYSPSLMIEDGVVYGLLEELRFDDGCITNGTLYIPEGVTNIASSAFNGCSEFCNVNLPDTLQSIGDYAFSSSSLTNVIIPASVQRVGYWAFDGCGESLYDKASIPGVILVDGWAVCYTESLSGWLNLSGVSGIGKGAFNGCDSLTGVTIPDGVTCIDSDAFSCCSSLMGVAIPDSVTSIEGYAFHGCSSLAGVTIPSGVTKIGYQAFGGCERLERIRIPDGVKYVGVDAFANCMSLHTVTVPQLLCGWYSGSDEFSGDFEYNNLNAVMYCGSLTNLVIATGVTNIADGVFSGLCSLMGVTIPSSVTDIGRDVFNCCCSLENIVIPNGVTNIGPYAFSNCYSLRRVTIPDSVTHIGSMAFYSCYNLESLRIPDGITYIGHDAFGGCTALKSVTVPQLLCGWYSSSDEWEGDFQYSNLSSVMYCGSLTNLVIATGVTNIADNVFSSCDSLIGVTIPNSVVSIGAGAFACCGFESVSIPDGVLSISADAFYGCSRLVDVTIPDSVKSVCASAFWGCNDLLYDVTTLPGVQLVDGWAVGYDSLLPECLSLNGVRGVASEAFGYCDSLVGVTIPDGVKSVCASAFYGCSSLENVVFSGDISYVGACAFWECGLLGKVTVPQLLCGIYSNDGFNDGDGSFTYNHLSDVINCGSLTNLVLASGVTNIEERVFSYCGSLQEIAISDSVVNIGNYVFEGCYSLNSIYIPKSVENIGKYAFANCYNLMYAKIPLVLKNQIEEGNVFDGCPEDMRIDYYEILPLLAPVITPADGTEFYEDSCTVSITCETEGASIYYTTDGTTPRPRPANLYTEPFVITDTTTVKAIAVKGDERTDLVSATIVKKEIVLAAPVITPADGTEFYEDSCMVTISCATEGASIYYIVCDTNNVTNPRPSDRNLYTGPFMVSATKMVRAFSMFGSKTSDIVSATLIKRELTLSVAVDAPELTFTTGGDAEWTPEFNGSANVGGSLAQSGALSWSMENDDPSETWMETTVAGAGTFSFWWKVDCEDDPWGATWDHLKVSTNGVEIARIDGKTEWEQLSFTFNDVGTHTIRWTFCKDDWDDEKLPDIACVDGVVWTPVLTDITVDVGGGKTVAVPASWIDKYGDILAAVGGDKTAALKLTAANGRKVWECFMLGVDPTRADDDFRITRFWMENSKPKFEFSHSVDGAGNSFLSRLKIKGK